MRVCGRQGRRVGGARSGEEALLRRSRCQGTLDRVGALPQRGGHPVLHPHGSARRHRARRRSHPAITCSTRSRRRTQIRAAASAPRLPCTHPPSSSSSTSPQAAADEPRQERRRDGWRRCDSCTCRRGGWGRASGAGPTGLFHGQGCHFRVRGGRPGCAHRGRRGSLRGWRLHALGGTSTPRCCRGARKGVAVRGARAAARRRRCRPTDSPAPAPTGVPPQNTGTLTQRWSASSATPRTTTSCSRREERRGGRGGNLGARVCVRACEEGGMRAHGSPPSPLGVNTRP